MPPIGGWPTGVYRIQNLFNGKVYIGSSSTSLINRLTYHKTSLRTGTCKNRHLLSAYQKYGDNSFSFSVIERCHPERCLTKEQYWIDHYKAYDSRYGYNSRPKAESNLGWKHSPESLKRIAAVNQKRIKEETPEARVYRTRGIRIGTCTQSHKEKIRQSKLGKKLPEAIRKKIGFTQQGRTLTKAHREAIGRAGLGRKHTEATKLKISMIKKIRCSTPEFKEKMTETMRLWWEKRKAK